jgi:ribosomal protein L11 methylase PrmA
VTVPRETTKKSHEDLLKTFKLISRTTENITVWTEKNTIKRFDTVEDLIDWFVQYRLARYEDRRLNLIKNLETQKDWYETQMRFIQLYLKRSKVWSGMTDKEVVTELESAGLNRIDDLLSIRVRKLTGDAIEDLKKKIDESALEIARLNSMTATDLYMNDLSQLKL